MWTGASVGDEADGALTRVNGIHRRFPYQTNNDTRKALNGGKINYIDMHFKLDGTKTFAMASLAI